jgi:dihydropteroate synthase
MTQLVGILNVTPDSFSDGGHYDTAEAALLKAQQLMAEGAEVIDVGAESTRPGATALSAEDEWERLSPLLSEIVTKAHALGRFVSLDTRHAETAARGLSCGVDWINDVSGFQDPGMVPLLRESNCRAVLTHSLGIPADPLHHLPSDIDVIAHLLTHALRRIESLEEQGIAAHRLLYDPGIGFGKTNTQNLAILSSARSFKALGIPLLFGHSRKRFMQSISPYVAKDRDQMTLTYSSLLMMQGIDYLRVHAIGKHATLRTTILRKE